MKRNLEKDLYQIGVDTTLRRLRDNPTYTHSCQLNLMLFGYDTACYYGFGKSEKEALFKAVLKLPSGVKNRLKNISS